MQELKIKCLRCGSSNVGEVNHAKGNEFTLFGSKGNTTYKEIQLHVHVGVCNDCGEMFISRAN